MATRVALALGGGGARGYAHIGVINELQERGHQIISVAGSSMGAVVGGVFAAGRLDSYTEWVLGLSQRGVLRQLDPALSRGGIIRAERVLTRMVEHVGDHRIEELPVRFTATAVDLLSGREVWLDQGPLDRAIRASIAIPGVVTLAVVNGRLLVDGGVLNPVPVAATASSHADLVVAVSLQGHHGRRAATPTDWPESMQESMNGLPKGLTGRCACRKCHPCGSDSVVVLVEDSSQPLASVDVEAGDLGLVCDRRWQWS